MAGFHSRGIGTSHKTYTLYCDQGVIKGEGISSKNRTLEYELVVPLHPEVADRCGVRRSCRVSKEPRRRCEVPPLREKVSSGAEFEIHLEGRF
jgi:hypothetical protein